jgi:hypothetical protein
MCWCCGPLMPAHAGQKPTSRILQIPFKSNMVWPFHLIMEFFSKNSTHSIPTGSVKGDSWSVSLTSFVTKTFSPRICKRIGRKRIKDPLWVERLAERSGAALAV